jgi:tripartite-type tricarboxylate transporter receptor subunit TctC
MSSSVRGLAAALLLFLSTYSMTFMTEAVAQAYPTKPVRIVVPFPPGGSVDQVTRIIQTRFGEILGQPLVVEYKAGAGGMIGTAEVAKATPDGYTLLIAFDTHAVNHHLYKQAPDVFREFEHISLIATAPQMLVAGSSFQANNLPELIALAKAEPGKITHGSVGSGSSNHLGALLLAQHASIKMLHIPYKGGGPLVQAMLGNQVDITFLVSTLVMPHVKSGKVKPIGVGSTRRMPQLPDVPSLSETLPGFEQLSWFGLVAPKGIPQGVMHKIQADISETLATPSVRERLVASGFDVVGSSPQDFLRFVQNESDKLGKLIRDNGIKIE